MRIEGFEFGEQISRLPGHAKDANAVGNHLEALRAKLGGELTPQHVLDDAREENSPLHQFFTWSDSEAAEQFRLEQARLLIRTVVAIYRDDTQETVRQRAYVHIKTESASHYLETSQALAMPDTREAVLRRAWGELQGWRKKYGDLREFARIVGQIDTDAA